MSPLRRATILFALVGVFAAWKAVRSFSAHDVVAGVVLATSAIGSGVFVVIGLTKEYDPRNLPRRERAQNRGHWLWDSPLDPILTFVLVFFAPVIGAAIAAATNGQPSVGASLGITAGLILYVLLRLARPREDD